MASVSAWGGTAREPTASRSTSWPRIMARKTTTRRARSVWVMATRLTEVIHEPAVGDIVAGCEVCLGHLRIAVAFGDRHALQGERLRTRNDLQKAVGEARYRLTRVARYRQVVGQRAQDGLATVGHHGAKQPGLVAELVVDEGFRAAGACDDVGEGGLFEALFEEDLCRRAQHRLAPLVATRSERPAAFDPGLA